MNSFNRLKRRRFRFSSRKPAAESFKKFTGQLLALVICCWLISAVAQAAPGDLDPTFAGGGVTQYPAGINIIYSKGIALQPDGKILLGGAARVGNFQTNRRFAVARYLSNGLLDTSFGENGVAYGSLTSSEVFVNDIALLPSGKIVAVGQHTIYTQFPGIHTVDMIIAVFSPQGVQETLFTAHPGNGLFAIARAIAVQPDGKFLVVGDTGAGYCQIIPYKQAVMRFTENGSPDGTFGVSGVVTNAEALYGETAAVQPDGKIVTAGGNRIVRYLPDGNVDAGFGSGGTTTTPAPTNSVDITLAVQPDGKIVGAASINNHPNADFAAFRLNNNGSADVTFGTNGLVTTAISNENDYPTDLVLQPDGKIIVAGHRYITNVGYRPAIVRYNSNGSLDATYGNGGIVTVPNEWFYITDAVLQPDGKLLATAGFRVARYLGDAPFAPRATDFDFDGDTWADFAVTRNNGGNFNWYAVRNLSQSLIVETEWGLITDKIVPADYDGDRKTDVAVFRPTDGNWYILKSTNNSISTVQFGQNGDVPVPADFDGDSRADTVVYRSGNWYILNSADNSFRAHQFGIATDKPLRGDFDGDGRADIVVYRDGVWYAVSSSAGFFAAGFGLADDIPVPSDYDGDGKTDLAVYRPSNGTWYLQNTTDGFKAVQFGIATDKTVPADYDADGKTDIAVFREGVWYILGATGDLRIVYFGYPTDRPVATAFQTQSSSIADAFPNSTPAVTNFSAARSNSRGAETNSGEARTFLNEAEAFPRGAETNSHRAEALLCRAQ